MKLRAYFIPAAILGFILLSNFEQVSAQRRVVNYLQKYDREPYHFGFILAVNQMNFTWRPIDGYQSIIWEPNDAPDINVAGATQIRIIEITSQPVPGFAVGIVGNLRLGEYFDLRFIPSLAFGERYVNFNIDTNNDSFTDVIIKKSAPSTMVDFPLYIKYRSKRLNNFASYIIAGGKYSLEMASTKKIESANGNFPVKIDRNDFAAEAGVGFDFYTPYFKFGTELKMSYGLKNVLVKDAYLYSRALEKINNKVFQLSFTFE